MTINNVSCDIHTYISNNMEMANNKNVIKKKENLSSFLKKPRIMYLHAGIRLWSGVFRKRAFLDYSSLHAFPGYISVSKTLIWIISIQCLTSIRLFFWFVHYIAISYQMTSISRWWLIVSINFTTVPNANRSFDDYHMCIQHLNRIPMDV